ncbi:hypothetical protein [Pedobacter heparinus]|uniref:Capsule polysaccharide biosynthesis protein n=1 Tax=Pedobacter heparinus (strain ATCC 13125 / DSM 2366 / CIP 104194 / JCM 7457 / NBRC 12017 / NCIMB 9290 / NRRL B-14731 / HIM 762-3) TaxID=485917 RepID=C6XVP8_PEDHD|nr:hypothetical protein [Pedobacter heparinus]ACU06123.1 hypothetical protein Phep_3932 [Pedobacter heparinus DSM 2366]
MKEYYYFNYLKSKVRHADLLQYELDRRVYYFGDHFKISFEKRNPLKRRLADFDIVQYVFFLFKKLTSKKNDSKDVLISSVYFNFGEDLRSSGYEVYGVPWTLTKEGSILSFTDFVRIKKFNKILGTANLNQLTSENFQCKIDEIIQIIERVLIENNVKGVFVAQDVGFFERLTIELCKRLSIPTILVLHGAALRYGNTINDNKTDYLCVFGDIFKSKLVESGFPSDKVLVLGHPKYSNSSVPKSLKFDYENILVISKPIPGQPVEYDDKLKGRDKDTNRLKDRGNVILYLWMVQKSLESVGISKARLRVHPSENSDWYVGFLDMEFFEIDRLSLAETLNQSTLVIGPSSSLCLDSLFAGVNYTIFEPLYEDGLDILNDPVGHPFDGSDDRIPVAKDEVSLVEILRNRKKVSLTVLPDFISPALSMELLTKQVIK